MKHGQLLIVDTKNKKMYIYDDKKLVKTISNVYYGKNGVASSNEMIEGGLKTPVGKYKLGIAFGTEDVNIDYPYIKINNDSYWVDDSTSPYYNKFVQINSKVNDYDYPYVLNIEKKDFSSAEHLIEYAKYYKYSVFIEYNAPTIKNSAIPNKGSAIFLHCSGNKEYTYGCISVSEEDMEWIIHFLNKDKNPCIIIK